MNVILHTGSTPEWAAPLRRPWPLLPVGNRPWIEYWIEWCIAQGLTDIQLILGDGAFEIERLLGEGERWGVQIRYGFLRDGADPDSWLRRDPARWAEGVVFLRRPLFPYRPNTEPPAPLPESGAFVFEHQGEPALVFARNHEALTALLEGAPLSADSWPEAILASRPLDSLKAYYDLNMALAGGEMERYLTPGYRRKDLAYLGYNVVYPASAQLTPPLMIGNDVRLHALCTIGPRAILGNRVIVDRQADVADSIVLDGTYLGAGIELKGRIAAGRTLIDPEDGTAFDLDDIQLLAPLRAAGAHGEKVRRLGHRAMALAMGLVGAPFALVGFALGALRGGQFHTWSILGVRGPCPLHGWRPAGGRPGLLARLSLDRWPGLFDVMRGRLWLCGQQPVTPEEEEEARSWPSYRPALFTYADLRPDPEDLIARRLDAAYYAHHRGWREDARILLRALWSRLTRHQPPAPPEPDKPAMPTTSAPDTIAIIVINYRTPDYTIDCLASLEPERADVPGLHVILIDNDSGDDSVPRIREAIEQHGWGDWVTFLPQEKNHGFAGGNNLGFRYVLDQPQPPAYVLLLNSDTVVHRGCLKASLHCMKREKGVGIMSCMLRNRDGSVQNICRRAPTPLRETVRALGLPYRFRNTFEWAELEDAGWDRETIARDVDWVGGAFMLLHTETVRRLGGMDDIFFFYGEDIEFCHRMWVNGLRVFFDPSGSITHFGGGSSDAGRLPTRRKEILLWKARFQVQRRCYGGAAATGLRALFIGVYAVTLAWLTLTGKRKTDRYCGAHSAWTVLTHPLEIPQ